MFWSTSFYILFASLLAARADVFPNFPAAGVLRSGSTCRIGWAGDTASTTAWKDMTIQFMTGDNFNMVHLTTVATGQDGTVSGSYEWTCPEVQPNSAIYFYQFRSPHTPNYQWTTRFTIASSTGQTTPPPNNTQPDGALIPWGTGHLKDPSIALPPPVFPTITLPPTPTTPVPTATPTNVAPGVVSGCTGFFTETNLLCWQIVSQFSITLENFEEWNGGSGVCDTLQTGLAYCIARPTPTGTTPTPTSTPTNVAPNVVPGCTAFFTETNLLCFEIAQKFGITVAHFEDLNGGAGVCNRLQSGLAYCVAAKPSNVAPGVIAGCSAFFTETNLLCWQIAEKYGISVAQFQSWNGGSNVCDILVSGLAYCVAGPTSTTPTSPPVSTPTNVASGVVAGCKNFFTETNLLCFQIAANFGITVAQFESWNGAGVCNVLQTGKAYCVSGP